MAKVKGTDGDDTLVGTSGDDTIVPLLGLDSAGHGYDVLQIDYSAVAGSVFSGSLSLSDQGCWSGGLSSGAV